MIETEFSDRPPIAVVVLLLLLVAGLIVAFFKDFNKAQPLPTTTAGQSDSVVSRNLINTFLLVTSWFFLLFSATGCVAALQIAAEIPNSGYIADLQTQTNEVLFAVVVALVSIAAGIAALFLRLSAMLPNRFHPKV